MISHFSCELRTSARSILKFSLRHFLFQYPKRLLVTCTEMKKGDLIKFGFSTRKSYWSLSMR